MVLAEFGVAVEYWRHADTGMPKVHTDGRVAQGKNDLWRGYLATF
jgi:hypothetical protein